MINTEEIYNESFVDELEKIAKDKDLGFWQGTKGTMKATMGSPKEFSRYVGTALKEEGKGGAVGAGVGAGAGAIAGKILSKIKGKGSGKLGAGIGALMGLYGGVLVGAEKGIRKHLKKRGITRSGVLIPKYKATAGAMKKYNLKAKN